MLSMAQASKPPKAPDRADATAKCQKLPWTDVCRAYPRVQLTEQERDANRQLLALIPVAKEQGHSREKAPFKKAQQYATHHKGSERVDEPRAKAHYPPTEGDSGYDSVELQSFD